LAQGFGESGIEVVILGVAFSPCSRGRIEERVGGLVFFGRGPLTTLPLTKGRRLSARDRGEEVVGKDRAAP